MDAGFIYCRVYVCDYRRGFGLGIRFTDHLYTRLGTASSHSAVANPHTLQITTNSFPACCVFSSRSVVTASKSVDSSVSALKFSLNGGSLPTDSFLHRPVQNWLGCPSCLLITPRHGPRRQHRSFSYANRFRRKVFTETFTSSGRLFLLRICCPATDVVPVSVSRQLPRNECCFRAVRYQRLFLWLHSSCFQQLCHNMYMYLFINTYCPANGRQYLRVETLCTSTQHENSRAESNLNLRR
jgi:hypothetical protein